MTQEQKKQELAQFLITKGIIVPADVEAEITKMAGYLSTAIAEQKGLTTDIDKAYETMLTEKGQTSSVSPTQTTAVVSQPTETISAAEKLAITKTLLAQKQDRQNVSANTSCDKLILDRPAPADYIPAGTKGVISAETWQKIEEKWAGRVLEDDEEVASRTNFEILRAAAKAGTPVDVHIGSLNKKAIGYMMSIGSVTGASNQQKPMTREQATNFVVLETDGYILAGEQTPGLKLRYIKPTASKTEPGKFTEAKTVLAEANKNNAIEAGNYIVSKKVDGTNVKEVGVKTALCFKVDTGKPKANGSDGNIIRTVRVTVKANIPQLVRIPELIDVFGTGERNTNSDLKTIPEGKMLMNIAQAQQHAIADLRRKLNDPEQYTAVSDLADSLKAFEAGTAGPAPSVTL